ncbi:hypothetical protein [Cerasicoccus frondis]|uniref:hypothetical protein n=1 Tax=Cerasicoccus frondis TaxID=490090 RepID=UPI00285264AC|nr:hypothetical protein [Cerasicoccus frondis]
MINELESHQLLVVLAPAPRPMHEGHMVRVPYDRNPVWYRRLCAAFTSARRSGKLTTRIRRASVLRILKRLNEGKGSDSYLVPYLRNTAKAMEVQAA